MKYANPKYLVDKKKAYRIHLGEYIWDFLKQRGIKKTQETGMMAAMYIADVYNDVPIAEYAISQVKKAPKKDIYLIDSLRHPTENEILKKQFKNYYVISVNTDPEIRYGRESRRARFGESITKPDFEARDRAELKMGVGILTAMADFSIDANQSLYSVYEQTEKILTKIKERAWDQ